MHIHRVTAFQVPIALRKPVRHASHERFANETLIIRCVMNDGSVGWGEGLPRTYVTGESIRSAWRHLEATDFSPLRENQFSDTAQLAAAIDRFKLADVEPDEGIRARECFGNSVRCALELAILDAACRTEDISVGQLVEKLPGTEKIFSGREEVFYSGAITSLSPRHQIVSALKMRLFAFRTVKVKVGAAGINDEACLKRIRLIVGRTVDLRLDANEAWRCEDVCSKMQPLLKYNVTCLEQPVPHAEVAGLRHVRSELSVPVMLDESLCCLEDAERAITGGWCDLFNIRLSKCGGLLRSLKLAALARQHGLGFQLGCQVGETGILSAAGRHFACNVDNVRYLEGSFDRFLVHDALTEQDLTFQYRGRGKRLAGPGLGVDINECRVRQLAVRTVELIEP